MAHYRAKAHFTIRCTQIGSAPGNQGGAPVENVFRRNKLDVALPHLQPRYCGLSVILISCDFLAYRGPVSINILQILPKFGVLAMEILVVPPRHVRRTGTRPQRPRKERAIPPTVPLITDRLFQFFPDQLTQRHDVLPDKVFEGYAFEEMTPLGGIPRPSGVYPIGTFLPKEILLSWSVTCSMEPCQKATRSRFQV